MPRRDYTARSRGTVVQFGAGAIGRGFLGQLWSEAGFIVVFVERNPDLVAALNRRGEYPLHLVTDEQIEECILGPVRAIHTTDMAGLREELTNCAFAVVSVGPAYAEVGQRLLAPALTSSKRSEPLNILCAENDPEAPERLRRILLEAGIPEGRFSCVATVLGRMVPVPVDDPEADPLLVRAEPYAELPVEDRWLGGVPEVPGMVPKPHFAAYRARKLFLHNGGHALVAYHGWLHGATFIHQCVTNPAIVAELRGFWSEANRLLIHRYGVDEGDLIRHEDDLLRRFGNRALGDTIARVARDPARKLGRQERLVGVAEGLAEAGKGQVEYALRAAAAVLRYDNPDDPGAVTVQQTIQAKGLSQTFLELAGQGNEDPYGFAGTVEEAYNALAPRYPTPQREV